MWVKKDCAVMYLLQLSLYRLLNWDYSNEHSSSTSGPAFIQRLTEGSSSYIESSYLHQDAGALHIFFCLSFVQVANDNGNMLTHSGTRGNRTFYLKWPQASLNNFEALLWPKECPVHRKQVTFCGNKRIILEHQWFPHHRRLNATSLI